MKYSLNQLVFFLNQRWLCEVYFGLLKVAFIFFNKIGAVHFFERAVAKTQLPLWALILTPATPASKKEIYKSSNSVEN